MLLFFFLQSFHELLQRLQILGISVLLYIMNSFPFKGTNTVMLNYAAFFIIPRTFAEYYCRQRFPRLLLDSLCASQLEHALWLQSLSELTANQLTVIIPKLDHCTRLLIMLTSIHYFPKISFLLNLIPDNDCTRCYVAHRLCVF